MERPEISTTHVGGSLWIVGIKGDHDLAAIPDLRRELDRIFASGTTVVLDLTDATFIDSSMVAELVRAQRRVESSPGERLGVVAPKGGAAAQVLDLVDPERRFFPTFESRGAAIRWNERRMAEEVATGR